MPDPPRNLQLSCDHGEDGKVEVSWSPPDKAHGLVREYIVSLGLGGGGGVLVHVEDKASPTLPHPSGGVQREGGAGLDVPQV